MDIATMAHSLETRSPFLDQEFMAWSAGLPAQLKLDGSRSKVLLKEAMRGVLPDAVLDRPKMGFGVPLDRWFREDLAGLPAEILLDPRSLDRGLLARAEVERLIAAHRSREGDHSLRLWTLIQLEMWFREVVEAAPGPGSDQLNRSEAPPSACV
jgi:asparagine synthase (glutamine-hydrolysing)